MVNMKALKASPFYYLMQAIVIKDWIVKIFPELLDDTPLDGSEAVDRLALQLEVLNTIIKAKE